MMEKLHSLIESVRFNCELASLRQAGMYSVCGLAMRLRDLYKWEHGLMPWEEGDSKQVLQWIGQKEEFWDQILHRTFKPIVIGDRSFSPFETDAINQRLLQDSLYYGAGIGEGAIPSFFLGAVLENSYVEGFNVVIVEKEYARDLMANPAFSKNDTIVIRKNAVLYYLWNAMIFARKENQRIFQICFKKFGIDTWDLEAIKNILNTVVDTHLDIFIYHETGELKDTTIELEKFHWVLNKYQRTIIELLLRALKDLLSDTHEQGRFPWLVARKDISGLALSLALLDDFRKALYSDIYEALRYINEKDGWSTFSEAMDKNREKAKNILAQLINIIEDENLSVNQALERVKNFIIPQIRCNIQNLNS